MPAVPAHHKVVDRDKLPGILNAARQGKKVVFTNGCYDILHPGHVDLLARCKALGDILVMGINSDDSVRRLKGNTRPVNNEGHRQFVLAALEAVDYLTLFDEDTPLELITELKPDILVKGGDWSINNIVGKDVVEQNGGTVHSLPLLEGFSTTSIIEHIISTNK